MTDAVKFFSQEWCDAARKAVNANAAVHQGFKDAANFTNKMGFAVIEREDLVTHIEWDRGKIVSWTPRTFVDDELWIVLNGSLDSWKLAADGKEEGGRLLMAGAIKLSKGPMSAAIENAGAFNNFLLTWGQVPTEWAV
ncbi:hypothetical protein AWH04_04240 [Rhodococcus erythropolis]|uniref:hypothetical protein n=1 Tax=Rhodococcus sp. WY5 TaxID=2708349 RepID=UPI000E4DB1CD|nr:hypothetical protein [Rhodococcus sp. WY5]RGP46350.1 hypothetical protein AWH04_04240 [Rhodococcus erythropolis]